MPAPTLRGASEARICGVERTHGRDRADWPGIISDRETALHVMVPRARWHFGVGRLSSGNAPAHGADEDALTGRRSGRGPKSARHVSQSTQTGSGVMDVCVGARRGAYE